MPKTPTAEFEAYGETVPALEKSAKQAFRELFGSWEFSFTAVGPAEVETRIGTGTGDDVVITWKCTYRATARTKSQPPS